MLEDFFSHFKGCSFAMISSTFKDLFPILEALEENYNENDKDAKNAMIDILVHILLAHKDQ